LPKSISVSLVVICNLLYKSRIETSEKMSFQALQLMVDG